MAGEHKTSLTLKVYSEILQNQYNDCDRLVIQLESLSKCNYQLFENGIVILDEIHSLLSHLRSPTMTNRRADVYLYLTHIIKHSKYVIGLDADLADWNIEFLQSIKK